MSKRIEIITTVASLIEPGKKYLVQVDDTVTQEDADVLNKQIKEWGAESVVFMYHGKPLYITEVRGDK